MNNIEFNEGAVCYFDGGIWFANKNESLSTEFGDGHEIETALEFKDFQLNQPCNGWYIPKSELDTEEKYNQSVDVFGLLGFGSLIPYVTFVNANCISLLVSERDELVGAFRNHSECKTKCTYAQLMAIGELRHRMLEREKQADELMPFGESIDLKVLERDKPKSSAVSKVNLDINSQKPKLATQYLNECIQVQKQRGEQYDSKGTGERSFSACADAYNAITGGNLKGSDVCLILQVLKDVRQYSDPTRLHEDSLLDKVSYSSLHAEELNKELK